MTLFPVRSLTARTTVALALVAMLAGAAPARGAPAFEAVVVAVDVDRIAPRREATPRVAQVRVADMRTEAERALQRTTIGAVSMGAIHLAPAAPELVQAIVEAKADELLARRAVTEPQTVHCGIFVFDISTPATLLYWDVRARIEVRLRVQDREHTVSAAATERTYGWPSQAIVGRVVHRALEGLGADVAQALDEGLLPPR
jgi:hypothetical protein